MKGLLLTLGLIIALSCSASAAPQCHTSEVFECANIAMDWFHTLPRKHLAETPAEVDTMCTELNKAVDCALKFRDNCMTPLQKEMLTLTTEGAYNLRNDFCPASSPARINYEKHAPCYNKLAQGETMQNYLHYILALFEQSSNVEQKQLLTYICCGYRKMYNAIVKLSNENCGTDGTQAVLDIMKMALSALPDVLCQGFEGTEPRCTALLPPDGARSDPSAPIQRFAAYKVVLDLFKNFLD